MLTVVYTCMYAVVSIYPSIHPSIRPSVRPSILCSVQCACVLLLTSSETSLALPKGVRRVRCSVKALLWHADSVGPNIHQPTVQRHLRPGTAGAFFPHRGFRGFGSPRSSACGKPYANFMIFQEMSWIFMNFHDLSALRILPVIAILFDQCRIRVSRR